MPLCDQCPICKKNLSSRWHRAEWTIRTIEEDGKEIVRANLRVTCLDGQHLGVWVEGTVKFFHMNKFAQKYFNVTLQPYQQDLIYDMLAGKEIEINLLLGRESWSRHRRWWVRNAVKEAVESGLKVAVLTTEGVVDGKEWLKNE